MEMGQIVTAFNKTGKYIGEITGIRPQTYTVRILAVLTHPRQGDLHNPNQVDVPYFHERKASAFREQVNVPENMVRPYEGEVPDYKESLRTAVNTLATKLKEKEDDPYSVRSLEALYVLLREYELMYSIQFDI
ncbi:kinase-associated lipoprotein B [Bacillus sp. FJAT-50079]|uniref:kinase-associated lipoprotein B n=1 Tax=Bacillus sp. FJAT-50079 TaxID=2833577 RepID=UPI001BC9317B|nr:kinase-associated lipoprotein B [Bacillus sp. FJAT-50079]MBS4208556.1 kinase-associated lipoprotein B [Bacillus sp. FJAT-50079]